MNNFYQGLQCGEFNPPHQPHRAPSEFSNNEFNNTEFNNTELNNYALDSSPFPPSPAGNEIFNMEPGFSIALVACYIHRLKEISTKGVREKVKSAVATGGNPLSWELTDFPPAESGLGLTTQGPGRTCGFKKNGTKDNNFTLI